MSLSVKKVSFGESYLSAYQNFEIPSLTEPTAPQQAYQNAITEIPRPSSVPAQTYLWSNNNQNLAKTLGFASGGLALLSLGITGVSAVRSRNIQNTSKTLENFEQKILSMLNEKFSSSAQQLRNISDSFETKLEKEANERIGLGKWFDGIISDIKNAVKAAAETAERKSVPITSNMKTNFLTREVTVNGERMQLATTLHGYGKNTELLQEKLRTESAKRMLGLVDRADVEIPETVTIRVPTSEFKGIASTGGLSVVPKEVMANLGAFVNNKQKTRLIVDMPMYLGEVEHNSASGKQTYYALNALENGKFSWVSKAINKGDKDSIIAKNLEKIADMQLEIHDDILKTPQKVEVYLAKGMKQQVDYNLLKKYLSPEDLTVYNEKIERYLNVDAPAVREKIASLRKSLNSAQKREQEFIDNTGLKNILEEIKQTKESIESLKQQMLTQNNVQEYIRLEEEYSSALSKKQQLNNRYAELEKELEGKNPGFKALKEEIDAVSTKIKKEKEQFARGAGAVYKNGILSVTGDVDGHLKAEIEFDGVFYKNEKFDMKGPRYASNESDGNKTIYNNKTINAGESERFAYFNKYFYEFLTKSHEHTSDKLGADLIIGNDWQTGAISAMTRLLTKAKEAVGDLTPKEAEKLYNTPIITILHNAKEAGRSAHSNSKMLNVLFGEHSAMIAENAHMPDVSKYNIPGELGLPDKCWNGLMHQNCIDPQTMAASYSDVIVPVSDKYFEEIAANGIYGRENFELFRLRKYASDHADQFKGQKTITGITNGCDKVNNILSEEGARVLERQLKLPENSIRVYDGTESVLKWHNHNKKVILDRVAAEIKDSRNPMKIDLPEMTDLTGVDENTMVVSTAGRIVQQKGLDIFAESIEEVLRSHKFTDGNYPVFYAQGTGDRKFIEQLLAIKKKVAADPELGGEAAAKRIVFANLFSEPGRYDACKLMSDFSIMSSWFEPCGLVHKEIVAKSGAIPIVNETGGLTSGLTDGADAIFAKFNPESLGENKKNFANALWRAYEIFNNKPEFAKMMEKSYNNDFSWLVENGPMAQYVKLLIDLKVLKPEVLPKTA